VFNPRPYLGAFCCLRGASGASARIKTTKLSPAIQSPVPRKAETAYLTPTHAIPETRNADTPAIVHKGCQGDHFMQNWRL
jgi:hypothetical protein